VLPLSRSFDPVPQWPLTWFRMRDPCAPPDRSGGVLPDKSAFSTEERPGYAPCVMRCPSSKKAGAPFESIDYDI